MNSAIIVAAGSGKRFGGDIPKQFTTVNTDSLIKHTIRVFEECESIDSIVLVLPESAAASEEEYDSGKISRRVPGGKTRAESVLNGLRAVEPTTEVVAVHDGVRPLITCGEITATVEKARETGAACLVSKITDTIKEVSEGSILKTINRDGLRAALTPQCFRYEILMRAFENSELTEDVTDECYLVEKLGHEIAYVEGSSRNIKVTTAEDIQVVKKLLEIERFE